MNKVFNWCSIIVTLALFPLVSNAADEVVYEYVLASNIKISGLWNDATDVGRIVIKKNGVEKTLLSCADGRFPFDAYEEAISPDRKWIALPFLGKTVVVDSITEKIEFLGIAYPLTFWTYDSSRLLFSDLKQTSIGVRTLGYFDVATRTQNILADRTYVNRQSVRDIKYSANFDYAILPVVPASGYDKVPCENLRRCNILVSLTPAKPFVLFGSINGSVQSFNSDSTYAAYLENDDIGVVELSMARKLVLDSIPKTPDSVARFLKFKSAKALELETVECTKWDVQYSSCSQTRSVFKTYPLP